MSIVVPNEREHITILIAIAASSDTIPNYHTFKSARLKNKYISQCERKATMACKKMMDGKPSIFRMYGGSKKRISHQAKDIL